MECKRTSEPQCLSDEVKKQVDLSIESLEVSAGQKSSTTLSPDYARAEKILRDAYALHEPGIKKYFEQEKIRKELKEEFYFPEGEDCRFTEYGDSTGNEHFYEALEEFKSMGFSINNDKAFDSLHCAFDWWACDLGVPFAKNLADVGVLDASYVLAKYYLSWYSRTRAPHLAIPWLRKASEGGHAKAMYQLGVCYLEGDGVEESRGLGTYWMREAADSGDKEAIERIDSWDEPPEFYHA